MIFSAYRKDDFADPDSFVLQVGLVLERYPDGVIQEVSSPLTGIQRKSKFPPTIADLVEACDQEVARLARIQKLSQLKLAPREPRVAQHRANVFVPIDAPQHAAMVERAKTADPKDYRREGLGIWVALGWLTEDEPKKAKTFRRFTKADLEAIYRRNEGASSEAAE